MAKNNDKRAERMARSNRNVNRAITVLMAGVIAEFYLLMVNNYYVKGGVGQVLTMMTVLQVIDYIGCALFGAGLVVWLMRKKWTRFAPAAPWLLCIGFFFAVSSILMLKVYPQGTTMMCVIVPVVMLIRADRLAEKARARYGGHADIADHPLTELEIGIARELRLCEIAADVYHHEVRRLRHVVVDADAVETGCK